MHETNYNDVVSCAHSVNATETRALIATLPDSIRTTLASALALHEAVLRWDEESRRAFYITRDTECMVVWCWKKILTRDEAKALLASVDDMTEPLTASVATHLYETATSRKTVAAR